MGSLSDYENQSATRGRQGSGFAFESWAVEKFHQGLGLVSTLADPAHCIQAVGPIRVLHLCLLFGCVQLSVTPWTVAPPGSSVHGIFQARGLHLWSSMKFYKPLTYSEVYSGAGKCRYVGTFKRHTKNEVTHNVNHVNPDKRYLVGCTCETGTGGLAWQG